MMTVTSRNMLHRCYTLNVSCVETETYCNEVNIQITQRDDFIQKDCFVLRLNGRLLIRMSSVPA